MWTPHRGTRTLVESLDARRLFASASTLLTYDFNAANPWAAAPGAQSAGTTAALVHGGVGTIDVEGVTTQSGGLRLTVAATPAGAPWTSNLTSGLLAVSNAETNLGKLTLGFTLNASQVKPVNVYVTSYDANGNRTGALVGTVVPAAAYNYQRYALDLSTMKPSGTGTFNPTATKVAFDFEMAGANGWSTATAAQLRLDNVQYAKPAYYVKAVGGSNSNNGRTEQTAFATPQKAADLAQPGDVILLMNGTYNQRSFDGGAIDVSVGGTPAAWLTIKNYPGQSPVIYNEAWNAINIGNGSKTAVATTPAVAYVEIRGLRVVGGSAKVGSRTAPDGPYDPTAPAAGQYGPYGQYVNQADPRTNGNGITVEGRYETNRPHDIRIADNVVEDNAGGGINVLEGDRVLIENNVTRDNCYWDIYGTSGISVLSAYNFDGTAGNYTRVVRNNVSGGNIHKQMWAAVGKYSDGNGIIIDINHHSTNTPNGVTVGRTLVTNNVSFDNGGSGIHTFGADHVDIINNVAYLNSASPYLQYGQIFAGSSGTPGSAADVNISNNILVAPVAPSDQPAERVTGGLASSTIVYRNNVYFGGNTPANTASYNTGNVIADPQFVNASVDSAVADFRLRAASPAVNLGLSSLAPASDLAGNRRYGNPDAGAYEYVPPVPTGLTLAAASDTGTAGDNRTRFNNASATARLSFVVSGTVAGATVAVYANGLLLGSAVAVAGTTTVFSDPTFAAGTLANGAASITASQTFAGAPSSISPALAVAIDAGRPTLVGAPVINLGAAAVASRSQVRTVTWTFSEPVIADVASFSLADRDTNVPVSLSTRTATLVGNVLTLTLDTPGLDAGPQLLLANGNYRLALSPTVADAAGNAIDADGDGTPGETARLDFFKLLGDFNGDRKVISSDYVIWNRQYGRSVASGADAAFDLNGDGNVTTVDYVLWNRRYDTSVAAMVDGLTYG